MTTPSATLVTQAGAAEALHQVIAEVTGSDGAAHADMYARAGSRVAAVLTRGGRFVPCAGSLSVDGRELRARHAWIARLPAAWEPGPPLGRPLDEIIDFTMAHWPAWADEAGVPCGQLPPLYWGSAAVLARLGVALVGDPAATAELVPGQPDQTTRLVADRALALIAAAFPAERG